MRCQLISRCLYFALGLNELTLSTPSSVDMMSHRALLQIDLPNPIQLVERREPIGQQIVVRKASAEWRHEASHGIC